MSGTVMTPLQRAIQKLTEVSVSPRFGGILAVLFQGYGALADEYAKRWGGAYTALTVTSDGFLLGQLRGDIGYNDFIGGKSELEDNIRGAAAVAELSEDETAAVVALAKALG